MKILVLTGRGVEVGGRRGDKPLKGELVCMSSGKSTAHHAQKSMPLTERSSGNCSMQHRIVPRFWSCSAVLSSFAVTFIALMIYA